MEMFIANFPNFWLRLFDTLKEDCPDKNICEKYELKNKTKSYEIQAGMDENMKSINWTLVFSRVWMKGQFWK